MILRRIGEMANEIIKDEFKQVSSLLNFAHPTNWVLEIPIKNVGLGEELEKRGYDHRIFAMNITTFTLNRMALAENTVQSAAYTLSYPTGSEETEKEFTINYRLSSEYQQYYFLTRWWQYNLVVAQHIGNVDSQSQFLCNINLWVLNDYKDPVMKITYNDCWLKELGELQLSYNGSDNTLEHSFTCKYNNYKIELL